jgi:hypothetical protein
MNAMQSETAKVDLSTLTYAEVCSKVDALGNIVAFRESEYLKDAGNHMNSAISGFHGGSLSVTTPEEVTLMHDLKQELMSRTGSEMEAARGRNIARRAARKASFSQNNK